mgnify:CR=1 FL=1
MSTHRHQGCDVARCGLDITVAREEARLPHTVTSLRQYRCVACEGTVLLRRTSNKRYRVPAFFAHTAATTEGGGCTGGGRESQEHLMGKYYLKRYVGYYDFCVGQCSNACGDCTGFVSRPSDVVEVERSAVVGGKRYRYDTMISRRGKPRVAVEVLHTHKTSDVKAEDTRRDGVELVEVCASDILKHVGELRAAKRAGAGSVTLPNAHVRRQLCAACQVCEELLTREREDGFNSLQRQAFQRAREADEAWRSIRDRRYVYRRGNVKCILCMQWRLGNLFLPHGFLRAWVDVPETKWPVGEYLAAHSWFVDAGRRVPRASRCCRACVMNCPGCTEFYPIKFGLRDGMCQTCVAGRRASAVVVEPAETIRAATSCHSKNRICSP